jgi:LacI family transcriptional regulator
MKRVLYLSPRDLTFSTELIKGIGLYCQKQGFWEFHIPDPANWPYTGIIETWKGDGIITQVSGKAMADLLAKSKCAYVNLTAYPDIPTVTNDNMAIGQMGADFLLNKRFKNYVFAGRIEAIFAKERWLGFRDRIRAAGFEPIHLNVPVNPATIEGILRTELPRLPQPMAMMVSDDYLAHDISIAALECGIGPDPSRLAMLGVNNSPEVELYAPPLSSIRLNGKQIGYKAAEMLDKLMAGEFGSRPPVVRIKPLGIEERASTAQYGFDDPPISNVLERIRIRAGRAINIEELLIDIPLSRRTFERRFKRATDRTPWEEIRRVQIDHVKQLLERTDWSIKRIALSSAFKTSSRMAAVFREEAGETPQAYRSRFRL